ncbi:MAG: helix-turn-helix domain-containing protein [Desulfotomaculaceae bacterium]
MEPVRKNRTESKKEETKKKIISVAVDLFNRQGFDRTTVEQIAEEADVAKGTIFNHFPAKEAIVHEYVQIALRDTGTEAVSKLERLPDTRSRLTVLLRQLLQWFENNLHEDILKKYMVYMMQRSLEALGDENMRSGFNNILTPVIRIGQEDGEIRRDIPAEELSNHLEWLSASMMMAWLAFPEKSLTDILDREIDLFLSGAVVRPAQNM